MVVFGKSDSAVVSVPLFCCWFHNVCMSELNRSALRGSPCLVPCLKWKFECDVGVHCSLLLAKHCAHLYVWFLDALFPQSLPYAAVGSVECLFEINGCNPKRLWPLGDSLS